MNRLHKTIFFAFSLAIYINASAQCQSTGTGNWNSSGTWTNCSGGTPTSTGLDSEILSGHTVTLPNNANEDYVGNLTVYSGGTFSWGDSKSNWTGNITVNSGAIMTVTKGIQTDPALDGNLIIDGILQINAAWSISGTTNSSGTLQINAAMEFGDAITVSGGTFQVNAATDVEGNVTIENGAVLDIEKDMNIGSANSCGFNLDIQNGATIDEANSASDLIKICTETILLGNSANCDDITDPSPVAPYCLNAGDISGPFTFDENGIVGANKVNFKSVHLSGSDIIWETSFEQNSDYFEIQGSYDLNNFNTISEVQSANNITGALYQHSLELNYDYYKIVEYDYDGSTTTSKIVSSSTNAIGYYPNPASHQITFYGIELKDFLIKSTTGTQVNVDLINNGFNVDHLDKGLYYVVIKDNNTIQILPLIVE